MVSEEVHDQAAGIKTSGSSAMILVVRVAESGRPVMADAVAIVHEGENTTAITTLSIAVDVRGRVTCQVPDLQGLLT